MKRKTVKKSIGDAPPTINTICNNQLQDYLRHTQVDTGRYNSVGLGAPPSPELFRAIIEHQLVQFGPDGWPLPSKDIINMVIDETVKVYTIQYYLWAWLPALDGNTYPWQYAARLTQPRSV